MAKKEDKQKSSFRRIIIWFWLLLLSGISVVALLFYLVSIGVFGPLPTFEELENPQSNLASEVYAADQVVIGKYFAENRTNVTYDEISPNMVNALVATEDERFYDHAGIDMKSLGRVVWGVLTGQTSKGGGSTLTQQLAKMLFHHRPASKIKRVVQKLKEWVISIQLEKQYTKEEIITMYLNKFDFINNAVGIKSAAGVYFGSSPDSLKIEEAAMLVGMAKNPALFNPVRRPDTTQHRRNVVFYQMMRNNFITREEYDSLKQLPIELQYHRVDHNEGLAPYFREKLRARLKEIFHEKDPKTGEYLLKKPDGSPYDIYRDGLKVYTTLNSRMQSYAEWAVSKHLGGELQEDFWNNIGKQKNAPFDWRISSAEIEQILTQAMKRSQRYRVLAGQECGNCGRRGDYVEVAETDEGKRIFRCKADDCEHERYAPPKDSIRAIFEEPVNMKVFSWKGEIDTLMSPMDSIKYYKSFLQSGFMAMDPHTGYIKAWVGGINSSHFSYDHVIQGRRQVGSTFKPIVYSLAIQEGYSPCYEVPNVKTCFDLPEDKVWCPKNAGNEYGGMMSLKYGLANSINTVTAWVMKQFGPKAVINMARRMGITSPLEPVPSLCLGVADVSVYEMVGANATLANKGVWTEPIFLTRIEDKNGNVIKEFLPKTREAMSEETAYVMLELMKGVVDGAYNRFTGKTMGTAMRLRFKKYEYANIHTKIAAKTGTTQNQSDGWFMGITPDLVAGVWVGAEDRAVRFNSLQLGMGTNMALPIWGYFMNKVYADKKLNISQEDFQAPENGVDVELNCRQYFQNNGQDSFDLQENFNQ